MMTSMDLAFENAQYRMLTQACLGLISPNMRTVAMAIRGPLVFDVLVVLKAESPRDREVVQLIGEEFWALQEGPGRAKVNTHIVVDGNKIAPTLEKAFWPIFSEFNYP